MPDEFYVRATLVKERIDRLCDEAQRADPERLSAIHAEVTVLHQSMIDIREEQLIASLPKPKPPKRTLWQRLRRAPALPPMDRPGESDA